MNDRQRLLEYLYSSQVAALQTSVDVKTSENKPVFYNLDYSAIFFGIWRSINPRTLYDSLSGDFYHELTKRTSIPFTPLITSPTFYEMMEGFQKQIDHTKTNVFRIDGALKQIKKNINDIRMDAPSGNFIPIKSIFIQNELRKLHELSGAKLRKSVGRAQVLFGQNGPVKALGDISEAASLDLRSLRPEVQELYRSMRTYREGSETNKESSEEELRFRYLVDVWNVVITNHYERSFENKSFDYVSKARYTSRFCKENGRTPLVPLFWLRSTDSEDLASNREISSFFDALASQAKFIEERVVARPTLPRWEDYDGKLISAFNEMFMDKLILQNEIVEKEVDDEVVRMTDAYHFKRKVDEEIELSKIKARDLYKSLGSVFGDDLIEEGGFERLEYFRNLRDQLDRLNQT